MTFSVALRRRQIELPHFSGLQSRFRASVLSLQYSVRVALPGMDPFTCWVGPQMADSISSYPHGRPYRRYSNYSKSQACAQESKTCLLWHVFSPLVRSV